MEASEVVDDVEMEKDPQTGILVVVKSADSNERSCLRFTNKTNEYMQIVWIDYSGHFQEYKVISPTGWLDVNTFASHPWIFRHPATKERFTVNGQKVFKAPKGRRRGEFMMRYNCCVCKPVRSLHYASLLAVAAQVDSADRVSRLGLPLVLVEELRAVLRQLTPHRLSIAVKPEVA